MADTILTIDAETRTIDVGDSLILGVAGDEKANRIYFTCPKIVGNDVDLSTHHIYINYQNADGEVNEYLVEDLVVDTEIRGVDKVVFSWELYPSVCKAKGNVKFSVCAKKLEANGTMATHWNTTTARGRVLAGLEKTAQEMVDENADVIEQILSRLDELEAPTYDIQDELDKKLDVNLGAANSGKILTINEYGDIVPAEGSTIGTVDEEDLDEMLKEVFG